MTVAQMETPVQIETLEAELRTLFGKTADELARETHFVKRTRKLSGSIFAQTLVFAWLANADASYTHLQQMMAVCGCDMSAQALEKRFTPEAADFLLSLLCGAAQVAIQAPDLSTDLLARFAGVYLQDGSVIGLPNDLEGLYRGGGGNTDESGKSGLRIQVRINMSNGELLGPWVQEARTCERKGAGRFEANALAENALRISDSNFFTLSTMRQISDQKQWFLTCAKAGLTL